MAEERSDIKNDDADGSDREKTNEIKEQIEDTRNQMGETIDAIQDKLSFSNISEQVSEHVNNAVETAKDAVYDATIGKAASFMKNVGSEISHTQVVRTLKNNPLPVILIGAGVGLLAYQAFAGKRSSRRRRHSDLPDDTPRRIGSAAADSERVVSDGDKLTGVAGDAYDKVSGAVGDVYTGARDAVSSVYEKVGGLGSSAREQYETYIEENPLAVGAVALALGAAVGMAIPSTSYESQLMGNARQELLDMAQNTASDLIEQGKDVVAEAGRTLTKQVGSLTD